MTTCRLVHNYLRFTDQNFWIFTHSTALFQQATDSTISLYPQHTAFLKIVRITLDRKLNIRKFDQRQSVLSIIFLKDVTSHHITPHHITPHHITSRHITSHHITSHHITSRHIRPHHITSHHITPHHTTLKLLTLRHDVTAKWLAVLLV